MRVIHVQKNSKCKIDRLNAKINHKTGCKSHDVSLLYASLSGKLYKATF